MMIVGPDHGQDLLNRLKDIKRSTENLENLEKLRLLGLWSFKDGQVS